MDAPILTAAIGVGGSLMGTIIGGCLTMYSNFFLNKRRERAEFRIGCRLIDGELEENHALVGAVLNRRSWWQNSQRTPGKSTDMSSPLTYPWKIGVMYTRRYRRFTSPGLSGVTIVCQKTRT